MVGLIFSSVSRETDRSREHLIRRLRKVALHTVHDLGRNVPLVGGMAVHAVIDQTAVRHLLDDVAGGRRIAPQHGLVSEAVLSHLSAHESRLTLLVEPVHPAELVEERQHGRQGITVMFSCPRPFSPGCLYLLI